MIVFISNYYGRHGYNVKPTVGFEIAMNRSIEMGFVQSNQSWRRNGRLVVCAYHRHAIFQSCMLLATVLKTNKAKWTDVSRFRAADGWPDHDKRTRCTRQITCVVTPREMRKFVSGRDERGSVSRRRCPTGLARERAAVTTSGKRAKTPPRADFLDAAATCHACAL